MTRRIAAGMLVAAIGQVALIGLSAHAFAETIIIEKPMPALIEEVVPPAQAGFAWVPGHWVFRGREWFWVKGHYVKGIVPPVPALIVETAPPPPSPHHLWVKGHWAWEEGRWAWHRGIWIVP